MPYSVAAMCLHMLAQSEQEHSSSISLGDGNKPVFGCRNASSTALGNFPASSSTSDASFPSHAWTTRFQVFLFSFCILIVT